jgi:DNA-binding NtrC family response regulator
VEGACVLASEDVVTLGDFERATASPPSRAPLHSAAEVRGRAPRSSVSPSPGPTLPRRPGRRASAQTPAASTVSLLPGTVAIPADATLAESERLVVRAALRRHGTRARAARALGIGLRTLYTKLAEWGREEDAESA